MDKTLSFYQQIGKFLGNLTIQNDFSFTYKQDGSPVTTLDLEIDRFITKLSKLFFPDFQYFSEEAVLKHEIFSGDAIIVDPLDGTSNFLNGIPIWSVGIAIYENFKIDSAIVFMPEMKLVMPSKKYQTAVFEGFNKLRNNSVPTRINAYSSEAKNLHVLRETQNENRIFGSSLFNLAITANKAIHFTPNPEGSWLWDIAPGLLFCKEEGFEVLINGELFMGQFLNPYEKHFFKISPCN